MSSWLQTLLSCSLRIDVQLVTSFTCQLLVNPRLVDSQTFTLLVICKSFLKLICKFSLFSNLVSKLKRIVIIEKEDHHLVALSFFHFFLSLLTKLEFISLLISLNDNVRNLQFVILSKRNE